MHVFPVFSLSVVKSSSKVLCASTWHVETDWIMARHPPSLKWTESGCDQLISLWSKKSTFRKFPTSMGKGRNIRKLRSPLVSTGEGTKHENTEFDSGQGVCNPWSQPPYTRKSLSLILLLTYHPSSSFTSAASASSMRVSNSNSE